MPPMTLAPVLRSKFARLERVSEPPRSFSHVAGVAARRCAAGGGRRRWRGHPRPDAHATCARASACRLPKMVTPLVKVKCLKKRTNRFKRHQSDRKMAVKVQQAAEGEMRRWDAARGPCPVGDAPPWAMHRLGMPREAELTGGALLLPACAAGELAASQGYRLPRAP